MDVYAGLAVVGDMLRGCHTVVLEDTGVIPSENRQHRKTFTHLAEEEAREIVVSGRLRKSFIRRYLYIFR